MKFRLFWSLLQFTVLIKNECSAVTSLWITSSPATVNPTTTSSFNVAVSFISVGATADRSAVIDILNENYAWFGKGVVSIGTSSSGSTTITVTPSGITTGNTYILKAWIVDTSIYNNNPSTAWQSALAVNTSVTFSANSGGGGSGGRDGCSSCKVKYFGVNLAGAEFGDTGSNGHILSPNPGTVNVNYIYSEPGGSSSWFAARGMNTFRIPVRWERLQSPLGAGSLKTSDLNSLKSAVNHITQTLGCYAIIDIHNYARYNGNFFLNSQFQQFWALLAAEFQSNSKVVFGLMNEPYSMDTDVWIGAANAGIAGIRSTGAKNIILVPGNRWTGAHSWYTSNDGNGISNAAALLKITDSGNNYLIEMHQYLDSDYSGTSAICVSNTYGRDALVSATGWLRTNNLKGFLGEFGGGSSSLCLTSADYMLTYMENNSDVWTGWTWWAAGPWWNSYFMSIEPSSGNAATQFSGVLKNHICDVSLDCSSSPSASPSSSASPPPSASSLSPTASAGGNNGNAGSKGNQVAVGAGVGAAVILLGSGVILFYLRKRKIPVTQLFSPRLASPSGTTKTSHTVGSKLTTVQL